MVRVWRWMSLDGSVHSSTSVYAFRDNKYWDMVRDEWVAYGDPGQPLEGVPHHVDASLRHSSGDIVVFKGDQYWLVTTEAAGGDGTPTIASGPHTYA